MVRRNHLGMSQKLRPAVILALPFALLTACANLSQMQKPVTELDKGAHSVSVAEDQFLDTVERADCDSQFFNTAYRYSVACLPATARSSEESCGNVPISLVLYCKPTVIKPAQIAQRKEMMAALVLYSDKLRDLASTKYAKPLSKNLQAVATRLENTAKKGQISLPHEDPTVVAAVTAAFTAIANMALEKKKYDGVVDAARNMNGHIDALVKALTKENYADAHAVIAGYEVLESDLRREIALNPRQLSYRDKVAHAPFTAHPGGKAVKSSAVSLTACTRVSKDVSHITRALNDLRVAESYFAIIEARNILVTETGRTPLQLATADWHAGELSKSIDAALAAVEASNDAIARGSPGGVSAAVRDLYARVKSARNEYKSMPH